MKKIFITILLAALMPFVSWSLGATNLVPPSTLRGTMVSSASPPAFFRKSLRLLIVFQVVFFFGCSQ